MSRSAKGGRLATFRTVVFLLGLGVVGSIAHPVCAADRPSPPGLTPDLTKKPASQTPSADELFVLLDADGDGKISRVEWTNRKMAVFFLRDANGDLKLTPDEVPGLSQAAFDAADTDHDGKLSGFEFIEAPFLKFDKADTNHDGVVDPTEFAVFLRQFSK